MLRRPALAPPAWPRYMAHLMARLLIVAEAGCHDGGRERHGERKGEGREEGWKEERKKMRG